MLEKLVSSKVKRELLKLFIQNPEKVFYQSEIKFKINYQASGWSTIQGELRNLTSLGIIETWSDKIHRYFKTNKESPLFPIIEKLIKIDSRSRPLPKIGKGDLS